MLPVNEHMLRNGWVAAEKMDPAFEHELKKVPRSLKRKGTIQIALALADKFHEDIE